MMCRKTFIWNYFLFLLSLVSLKISRFNFIAISTYFSFRIRRLATLARDSLGSENEVMWSQPRSDMFHSKRSRTVTTVSDWYNFHNYQVTDFWFYHGSYCWCCFRLLKTAFYGLVSSGFFKNIFCIKINIQI